MIIIAAKSAGNNLDTGWIGKTKADVRFSMDL